jgi:DNA-binding CsgD family transcriptional regulator
MNQEEFDLKYLDISIYQRPVLNHFLSGKSDREIAKLLSYSEANVRQHISKVCRLFDLKNRRDEHERLRKDLVEVFVKYKPELVSEKLKEKLSDQKTSILYPGGSLPSDCLLYIDREPIENNIKAIISEPRALVRICAPSKFGKTSLLNRIIAHAKTKKFRTVYINLKQAFDQERLKTLEVFLRCFCNLISEDVDTAWKEYVTPQINCTRYTEAVLKQRETPFLLVLDGVEAVYDADAINQDFFQMLRSWHDKASAPEQEQWQKIRQVIVYSSDNYGKLDLARSPFNIGRHFELEEFNEYKILELTQRYRLSWDLSHARKLMTLIGGHPYLVNLALYHFAENDQLSLEQFLRESTADNSIYQEYLHSLANYIETSKDLSAALPQIINSPELKFRLETKLKYKLYSMGAIKNQNSKIAIRCQLYQQYFRKYFGS